MMRLREISIGRFMHKDLQSSSVHDRLDDDGLHSLPSVSDVDPPSPFLITQRKSGPHFIPSTTYIIVSNLTYALLINVWHQTLQSFPAK